MNIMEREIRASYDFFFEHLNNDPASPGYGLVSDNDAKPEMASIACVGFALSGFVIGVERGWMTKAELLQIVRGTLRTFVERVPHYKGFFVHFVERSTGDQYRKSEYSTIDTVLFLNGAMTATAYLNDPEAFRLLDIVFDRIDFEHFVFDYKGRPTFRMAYNPLKGGAYSDGTGNPWIYHWHMTAEQLAMYVLAAGSKILAPELARGLYLGFDRKLCDYNGHQYFYSPSNGLFVYQYSHAWIDFQTYRAPDVDWFENSRQATLGNYQWCVDHQDEFSTLSNRMWGLTACLTQNGYRPQGVQPTDLPNGEHECFNVYPPSGPAGSAPFCPDLVFDTLQWLDQVHPQAFGRYGFVDGIEKRADGSFWYCPHVIGINKGVTLLMLDNALTQTTWKYYHAHPTIQKGLKVLEFTRKKG
jgi:hypothetical protein